MIDAFWTKWRVRRLCRGDAALVGKWLDDYVGWLYCRLWVQSGHDAVKAGQALADAFSSAAGHLNQWMQQPCPMSEWLLTWVDPRSFVPKADSPPIPDIQNQVQMLWTHPFSETTNLTPELLDVSQQALSMLSRDGQEAMICRYLRLETLADLASHHGETMTDMQSLLYRARHSFRRSLESLTQAASPPEKLPLADQDVLDANLEKLFRSLGPKPAPAMESFALLKANIQDILSKQSADHLKLSQRRWAIAAMVIAIFGGIGGVFCLCPPNVDTEQSSDVARLQNKVKETVPEKSELQNVDVGQQVKQVLAFGERHDIEGLVEIVRTGSYSAQLAAAHFLGQFGDKSAIDVLDRAAQKWFPDKSSESNPFVDAIVAIEGRIRDEKKRAELEKMKQVVLDTALPLLKKKLEKTEPNAGQMKTDPSQEPNTLNAVETPPVVIEPNRPQSEPNASEMQMASVVSDANHVPDSK